MEGISDNSEDAKKDKIEHSRPWTSVKAEQFSGTTGYMQNCTL